MSKRYNCKSKCHVCYHFLDIKIPELFLDLPNLWRHDEYWCIGQGAYLNISFISQLIELPNLASWYIHTHKFTSKCHRQITPSSERDSQGQETFLAPSADKQTRNYDIECSNHHPSLSALRSKGLSRSKMKWWVIYKFTSKYHSQTTPSLEWR